MAGARHRDRTATSRPQTGAAHRVIRSTGTTRIDEAPASSSRGSSCQTSFAGTSACTATMPASASGSTLGEREPMISHDPLELRVRARSASGSGARAPRRRRASSTTICVASAPSRPISTASDENSEPSERSPFVRSVFPDETRSTIASASPSRGATSTEPVISTSSTAHRQQLARQAREDRRDRRALEILEPLVRGLRGHRRLEPARAVPERQQLVDVVERSRTRSSPVMPQSTTPSCTYSGMSSARTSSTSTGALRHGNASARSPGCSGPEAGVLEQRHRRLAQPSLDRDGDRQAVDVVSLSRSSASR